MIRIRESELSANMDKPKRTDIMVWQEFQEKPEQDQLTESDFTAEMGHICGRCYVGKLRCRETEIFGGSI